MSGMMRFAIPIVAAVIFLAALILDTEAVLRLAAAMLWDSGYVGLAIVLGALAAACLGAIRWKRKPAKRARAGGARAARRPGARASARKPSSSRRRSSGRARPR
jgi:ribosomal protein L4